MSLTPNQIKAALDKPKLEIFESIRTYSKVSITVVKVRSKKDFLKMIPLEDRISFLKEGYIKDPLPYLLEKDELEFKDIKREIEEDRVYKRDKLYFLEHEDYAIIQEYENFINEAKRHGPGIPSNIAIPYLDLLDNIKRLKRKYLLERAPEYFKSELQLKLKTFSKKLKKRSITDNKALKLVSKYIPNYSKVAQKIKKIELELGIQQFKENFKEVALEKIREMVPKDIIDYLSVRIDFHYFPALEIDYKKLENSDFMVLYSNLHLVLNCEVFESRKSEFKIADEEIPLDLDGRSLGYIQAYINPEQINMKKVYFMSLPIGLFTSFVRGEIQPNEFEVISRFEEKITYKVNDEKIEIPDSFIEFVQRLGESGNAFDQLFECGFIDNFTHKIIKSKSETKPLKPIILKEKDRERLKIIDQIKEHIPNSKWGKLFGIKRSAAYKTLKLYEKRKLVTLDKNEQGTKVKLTKIARDRLE